ncbi:MAG TPA: PEP-CTERM sorting domain-containing protein [Rhizomicrobium sp.]|nr:PEP-CTERM sorting domain-containing protein [Rhizomicrobium sp.]
MKRASLILSAMAFTATLSTAALAGPIYTFNTSTGKQPSDAGVITLTQNGANAVDVKVDLTNPTYGFLNTGGPHTPFAFNLAGSGALSIDFTAPVNGSYSWGSFSLNTAGGDNTPFGTFGIALDDSADNGSSRAFYGDLVFTLSRVGGLSTDDFIANTNGYYFSADLTNHETTGAQAWAIRETILQNIPTRDVPEPLTLTLFGAGLAGIGAMRRRKKVAAV